MAFSKFVRGAAVAGLATLLVVGCASLPSASRQESKPATSRPFDYHMQTLKNGMNVVTLEDHSTPIAAVQVWYHVGSRDEASNRRGFAHMFEHMMFRGTDHLGPKGHFEFIRGVGGDNNAYTSFDNTTYIQTVPSNQVEMVLWMEAERMGFLNINDEYFRVERDVVAEEYRMGAERPYGTVFDKILPEVFGKGAYCWSTIGNMDELKQAKASELQKFWETYYIPNNATLVVVGDVDHAKVEEMAERYFGWMPRYADPPAPPKPEPYPTTARKVTIKENNGPAPIVGLLWRTVPTGHPDDPALSLLGEILGQGESSRLYRDMVTDKQLAAVAAAGSFNLELDGIFGAGAVLSPMGGNKEKALKALREHIEGIRKNGVTQEELDKVKNAAERSQVTGLLKVESKAQELGSATVIRHDIESVNTDLGKLRAVTAADIQRVANTYLLPEREVELSIEPNTLGFLLNQLAGSKDKDKNKDDKKEEKIDESVVAAGSHGKPGLVRPADMGDKPPVASGYAKYNRPHRIEKTLDNGLRVVVIPNNEVPFVTCTLGNLNGAFTDPKEAPGTAVMAYSMLTHGTAAHDYKQLTDLLDQQAISISGSADMDVASLSASAVSAKADKTLEYMAEVVKSPTFPGSELDQLVEQQKTGREIQEKGAEYQAEKHLQMALYSGHPYERNAEGEIKDLDKLTTQGLTTWWQTYSRPDTSILYVAGDIDAPKAFELASRSFGDWKVSGSKPEVTVPETPATPETRIILVDRKGDQAQIRVGQKAITRHSPDWPLCRVVTEVLGGGFDSRLNDTVRVKKGLTYGIGGGFRAQRFGGSFQVSTFSKNATVGETVKTIIEELQRMKSEPASEKEMRLSVGFIQGGFAGSRETPQDVVTDEWLMANNNLPDSYFDDYLGKIGTATSEDVSRVARALIDEKHLAIVVVGQADVLKPQLEAIAPVTVVKP